MPENRPTIGEVWSLGDTHAVIVSELGDSGFQLMGRHGRIVNVTRTSLRHMWVYTEVSHTGPCSIDGCLSNASVRAQGEWYCGAHVPRNQPVLLPGDNTTAGPNPLVNGELSRCPTCNATRTEDDAVEMVGDVMLNRCTCGSRWVTLIAQGQADDGFNLAEDLQEAHQALELEFCNPIRALTGSTALSAIRRSFREVSGDNPRFAGIPLEIDETYGANTITVLGVSSGATEEYAAVAQRLLGTHWHNTGTWLRIIAVEEAADSTRQIWLEHLLLDECRQMSEAGLRGNYREVAAPTVTEVDGGRRIQGDPEYVGTFTTREELPLLSSGEARFEGLRPHNPSSRRPVTGETWWSDADTQVDIFGTGRTSEGADYVRFSLGKKNFRMLVSDFTRVYQAEDEEGEELVVGAEYVGIHNTVVTLKSVGARTLEYVFPGDRTNTTMRVSEFRKHFKQLIRRSAIDRLLDDEDLI